MYILATKTCNETEVGISLIGSDNHLFSVKAYRMNHHVRLTISWRMSRRFALALKELEKQL